MIRVFAFVCCFPIFSVFSQDSAQYALSANFQYHPQDFFFTLQASRQKNHLVHTIDFGFGINKTLFQQRFFPKVSYEFGAQFRPVSWLGLQPGLRFSYSVMDLRFPTKNPFVHLTELFAIGKIVLGEKHAAILGAGIGPGWEWKHDVLANRNKSFFMWNYVAEIGYRYVF